MGTVPEAPGDSMRARVGTSLWLLLAVAVGPSCAGSPPPSAPADAVPPPSAFSGERAWRHLEALVAVGARVPGSEASSKARAYLLDELSKLDLQVETHSAVVPLPPDRKEGIPVENLVAVVPGESRDLVILATPYDTRLVEKPDYVGANDGASGAAMLLELARVIAERPLPYTTWLVFLDGEALVATRDPLHPAVGLLGSTAFAASLAKNEIFPRVRLLVVFTRVGDAQLRIARDLNSHRMYREEFFRAAEVAGHTDAFRPDQPFESVYAGHRAFLAEGLRRIVAVSDTNFGGEGESGEPLTDADDTLENCSPESLEAVGAVTLVALEQIESRLAKIDRFAEYPPEGDGDVVKVPVGRVAAQGPDAIAAESLPSGTTEVAEPTAGPATASEVRPDAASSAPDSGVAAAEPEAAVQEPEAAVEEPKAAVEEPKAAVEEPKAAVEEPKAAVEEPKAAMEEPEAAVEEPSAAVEKPETAVEEPETAVEEPEAATTPRPRRPRRARRRPWGGGLGAGDL
jgi:glutaminyl-peptide cyclotransferase